MNTFPMITKGIDQPLNSVLGQGTEIVYEQNLGTTMLSIACCEGTVGPRNDEVIKHFS